MKTVKRRFLFISFTLLFIMSADSYGQPGAETEIKPYIEVTGSADLEVIPDEIYISIVIREKYVNREKISIEVQEEKLKAALTAIGIDLSNLSLSDANADYVKVRWQTKDVLTKKDYILKVSNAVTVGKVFQQLSKLEITDASISKVDHSRLDSLKREIRIRAIKAAKEKADYLLAAIGEQTGKPLIVQEKHSYAGNGIVNVRGSRSELQEYYVDGVKVKTEEPETELQFNKIKVEASVYVKFSIK